MKKVQHGERGGGRSANDSPWGGTVIAGPQPTGGASDDSVNIPWDLTQWVATTDLFGWVEEELSSLDWNNPELVAHLQAHPNYHPRMMLGVITFAYASGLFESEEIVRRCDVDPMFRSLCRDAAPESAPGIRKFRRDNRGLIKWSLNQVLKRAVARVTNSEKIPYLAGLKRFLMENATARIELARHLDRGG